MRSVKINTKIILETLGLIIILLIFTRGLNASFCYQESANQTNQTGVDGNCGLNYSGKYSFTGSWASPENLIDGNWSSIGWGFPGVFYVNYTKPNNALNTSLLQIKEISYYESAIYFTNVSISPCLDYYADTLAFRLDSGGSSTDDWYCYNGSWTRLASFYGLEPTFQIYPYEEAMVWEVGSCSCPGLNQNWQINMADNCIITTSCELGTGKLNFTGTGSVSIRAEINATDMGIPPANSIVYLTSTGIIRIR